MMNPSHAGQQDPNGYISDATIDSILNVFKSDYGEIIIVNHRSLINSKSQSLINSKYNNSAHYLNLMQIERIINELNIKRTHEEVFNWNLIVGTGYATDRPKKVLKYYEEIMDTLTNNGRKSFQIFGRVGTKSVASGNRKFGAHPKRALQNISKGHNHKNIHNFNSKWDNVKKEII